MTPTSKVAATGSEAGDLLDQAQARLKVRIPDRLFFRIGEVAELLNVKPHVLRYWESEFPIVAPQKSASGQRVYRRADVETVVMIRHLLHEERYSIEGARKRIRELRRAGALRSFKRGAAEAGAGGEEAGTGISPSTGRSAATSELALEALAAWVRKPLSELFRY